MSTLSPERWQAVSRYLDEALEMPAGQRAAWLEALAARDPELALLLQSLLNEHQQLERERFLEGEPATAQQFSALEGQTLGAYTLVSPLGEGGMGSVWLARRSDGRFERSAAIKFLNMSLAGRGGEERFRREGKILGQLSHPHVAELLDAGVSPGGQPYLVLEYVNGDHIDRYCDDHKLDVEARVRLFLDLLAAVAYAHNHLTVHRDIKPSNVLVTDAGEVKLVDFGIAKLLQEENHTGTPTLLTREMGAALTPQYAAPEQLTGQPVTTATDVYSLGVLLYVLLTGQHPAAQERSSTAALMKAIVETEPPRMSSAVARSGAEATLASANAERRATTAQRLRRRLRGDLDTIVAKALKKTPSERYLSVGALSDDLGRYLRHEPIRARPDSAAYRARKFLRRYWIPVAATAAVVASLAAGLYVANRERVTAQQRFSQLRELSNKVFDLDEDIEHLPGSTQARQRLVAAALQYLDGLAPAAHGDLDLTREIADGYRRVADIQGVPTQLNLGEPAKAEQNLKRANDLMETVLAARPHDRLALLHSAGIAHDRMILAQEEHRDADAVAYAAKSAERLGQFLQLGQAHELEKMQAAVEYSNIALAYLNMHRYTEAIPYAQRAADLSRPISNAQPMAAAALSLLASAQRYQGDLPGALANIQEARRRAEQATYSDPTEKMIDEYGILLREGLILGEENGVSLERPRDAIEPLQKAFDTSEELAQKDPHDATSRMHVAISGTRLGNILRQWNPPAALQVYEKALHRVEEVQNGLPAKRDKAVLLANSSYALLRLHRRADARQRLQEALAILRATKDYPADKIKLDSDLFVVSSALANDEAAEGGPHRALESYQDLLARVMAADPKVLADLSDAAKLSQLYGTIVLLYRQTGQATEARELQARRLDLWQHWNRKLPHNLFVQRELAAASLP
ncbi:MAG TPA: serine/threonine-protein kinase [Terriglobales bacterium]|nr:serine/threonine-protein kinase [Terriglobales bacterium]